MILKKHCRISQINNRGSVPLHGLCESDLPSSASMATFEGLTDAKEMISRLLEAAGAQHA